MKALPLFDFRDSNQLYVSFWACIYFSHVCYETSRISRATILMANKMLAPEIRLASSSVPGGRVFRDSLLRQFFYGWRQDGMGCVDIRGMFEKCSFKVIVLWISFLADKMFSLILNSGKILIARSNRMPYCLNHEGLSQFPLIFIEMLNASRGPLEVFESV